jgi:hypothetical protein
MKSIVKRRLVSSLVAVSVAVPSAAALLPASSLAAPAVSSTAGLNPSQIQQLLDYKDVAVDILTSLTPEEKDKLRQVREQIKNKPLEWWGANILQNPEIIQKLKEKGVTAQEAASLLRDAVALLYTPGDTLESLIAFKKEHYATWKKIFGDEFKQEDILKFVKLMQKQVLGDLVIHHMLNIDKPLDEMINDAIVRMMQQGTFKKLGHKLVEIGITPQDVVTIRKRLIQEFDPNNELRNILIRAFARSHTDIILQPGKLTPGKEKQLTLKVDFPGYFTIRSGVEWISSNPEVATVDEKGKLHAHKAGTTTVSVKVKDVVIGELKVTVEPKKEEKPPKDKPEHPGKPNKEKTGHEEKQDDDKSEHGQKQDNEKPDKDKSEHGEKQDHEKQDHKEEQHNDKGNKK